MSRKAPSGGLSDVSSGVIEEMRDLVDTYSAFAPLPSVSVVAPITSPGHIIFLSGTTGSLGSYLLSRLIHDNNVTKIYAFNRRNPKHSTTMAERHTQVFAEMGLDPLVLKTHHHKYEFLQGDLTEESFGLTEQQFLDMASSVNIIVHNAWPVNFNMVLKSFAPVIHGLRNLLSFAIASPHQPAFLFSSALATLWEAPLASTTPCKEAPIPPQWSISTGYSRSKWVAEQLLAQATKSAGLRTLSVRVGQLCGGDNGSWGTKEWFPSMIVTGVNLGMIPTGNGVSNWMDLSTAANAYVDFIKGSDGFTEHEIVHMLHPRPVLWQDLAQAIARELNLPVVSLEEWFKALHSLTDGSGQDLKTLAKTYPLIRILPFTESFLMNGTNKAPLVDSMGIPILETTNALRMSSTLRNPAITRLDRMNVQNWLRYWGLVSSSPKRRQFARL